jgi:hypothetical protein
LTTTDRRTRQRAQQREGWGANAIEEETALFSNRNFVGSQNGNARKRGRNNIVEIVQLFYFIFFNFVANAFISPFSTHKQCLLSNFVHNSTAMFP